MLLPSETAKREGGRQDAAAPAIYPALVAAILLNMLAIGASVPWPGIVLTYVVIIITVLCVERRILPGHVVLLISAVPSSFTNIVGGDYSSLPASLFNLAAVSMLVVIFLFALTGKLKFRNSAPVWILLLLAVMVIAGGLRTSLVSPNVLSAFKDLATVVVFILLWSAAIAARVESMTMDTVDKYVGAYLSAVVATAIFVLIQGGVYLLGDVAIGVVRGSLERGRVGFQALFSDMSVLSVYLASGAAVIVGCLAGRRSNLVRVYPVLLGALLVLVLVAALLTSARAGLVAFIVSVVIAFFNPFLRVAERIWIASRGALLGGLVVLIAYIYVATLGFRKLPWSVTGLVDAHRLNLGLGMGDFLWNNLTAASLLFGTAFGSLNHTIVTALPFTPHNFVMEGFLNGGMVMLSYLFAIIGVVLYAARKNMVVALPILAILAGAMVSPSMMESRYLGTMILIGLLNFVGKDGLRNGR